MGFIILPLICLPILVLACRAFWHGGTKFYYQHLSNQHAEQVALLDKQIAVEFMKCAASSPEAATILKERMAKWSGLTPEQLNFEYLRLLTNPAEAPRGSEEAIPTGDSSEDDPEAGGGRI